MGMHFILQFALQIWDDLGQISDNSDNMTMIPKILERDNFNITKIKNYNKDHMLIAEIN